MSPATSETPDPNAVRGRPPWLLLAGAVIGLVFAALGLLETDSGRQALSPDAAARVGERTIRRVDYERILEGVSRDLRNPLDESIRRLILDRMIDEELLVQRALELGLATIDRRVRGELTAKLMDSIVGEVDLDGASERELIQHFEENIDFFVRPPRLHAQTIFFSSRSDGDRQRDSAAERASRAAEQLRNDVSGENGENASEVEDRLGDPQISPLPNGMLPPNKIRDYVGPTVLRALEALGVGEWSEPIESRGGIYLARVVEREPRIVPDFEEVEDLVRQDLKRRRGDKALRDYLDDLRIRTAVEINESVFSVSR